MVTVLALLGVLGVLFAAAVLSTREQGLLADASPDTADVPLPADPLTPEDVGRLRFSMAARGYRMSEVDLALERLAQELADRDKRIGLLEAATRGKSKPEPVAPVREATPRDLPVPEERAAPSVVVPPAPVEPALVEAPPAAPSPAAPPLTSRTEEALPAPENAGEASPSEPEPPAAPLAPAAPTEPAATDPEPILRSTTPDAPRGPITTSTFRPAAWSSPSAVPAFPVVNAPDPTPAPPPTDPDDPAAPLPVEDDARQQ